MSISEPQYRSEHALNSTVAVKPELYVGGVLQSSFTLTPINDVFRTNLMLQFCQNTDYQLTFSVTSSAQKSLLVRFRPTTIAGFVRPLMDRNGSEQQCTVFIQVKNESSFALSLAILDGQKQVAEISLECQSIQKPAHRSMTNSLSSAAPMDIKMMQPSMAESAHEQQARLTAAQAQLEQQQRAIEQKEREIRIALEAERARQQMIALQQKEKEAENIRQQQMQFQQQMEAQQAEVVKQQLIAQQKFVSAQQAEKAARQQYMDIQNQAAIEEQLKQSARIVQIKQEQDIVIRQLQDQLEIQQKEAKLMELQKEQQLEQQRQLILYQEEQYREEAARAQKYEENEIKLQKRELELQQMEIQLRAQQEAIELQIKQGQLAAEMKQYATNLAVTDIYQQSRAPQTYLGDTVNPDVLWQTQLQQAQNVYPEPALLKSMNVQTTQRPPLPYVPVKQQEQQPVRQAVKEPKMIRVLPAGVMFGGQLQTRSIRVRNVTGESLKIRATLARRRIEGHAEFDECEHQMPFSIQSGEKLQLPPGADQVSADDITVSFSSEKPVLYSAKLVLTVQGQNRIKQYQIPLLGAGGSLKYECTSAGSSGVTIKNNSSQKLVVENSFDKILIESNQSKTVQRGDNRIGLAAIAQMSGQLMEEVGVFDDQEQVWLMSSEELK